MTHTFEDLEGLVEGQNTQGYQKGNFDTDYFALRNWALHLQT